MQIRKSQAQVKSSSDIQKTVLELLSSIEKIDPNSLSKITVEKFDKILSLISCNIKLSDGMKNFDTNDFRIDKSSVFNYKMKYSTTGAINKEDTIQLNLFYQKHKNIAKILLSK
tara:strand:+ start:9874 stop:10215 length:342 start_codon:yes stop_codon:yes gene_type:complete